nr:MAG TPA: hypothetical protein [Caudoviricetes sp.]
MFAKREPVENSLYCGKPVDNLWITRLCFEIEISDGNRNRNRVWNLNRNRPPKSKWKSKSL